MSPNLIHQLLEGKDKDENRTEPIRKRKQMKEKRRENELCKLYTRRKLSYPKEIYSIFEKS